MITDTCTTHSEEEAVVCAGAGAVRCGAALKGTKYVNKERDPTSYSIHTLSFVRCVCCIVPHDPYSEQEFLEHSTGTELRTFSNSYKYDPYYKQ